MTNKEDKMKDEKKENQLVDNNSQEEKETMINDEVKKETTSDKNDDVVSIEDEKEISAEADSNKDISSEKEISKTEPSIDGEAERKENQISSKANESKNTKGDKKETKVINTMRMTETVTIKRRTSKRKFVSKGKETKEDTRDEALEEKVVQIDRVTRVVKGGRRIRFRATVVLGDKKGRVGVAVDKGTEVLSAINKAKRKAKKELTHINLKGTTIPHEVTIEFCGARVFMKPASEGTGIIAGGAVRAVVEACGIKDILSKSLGSNNKLNNVQATFIALKSLRKFDKAGKKEKK